MNEPTTNKRKKGIEDEMIEASKIASRIPERCPKCGGRIKWLNLESGADTLICREPNCTWERDYEPWGGVEVADGYKPLKDQSIEGRL